MDKKFKWDMFITSFMPLWISIIVADVWNLIVDIMRKCSCKANMPIDLYEIFRANWFNIIVIIVITVLMITSVYSINKFLKDKRCNNFLTKVKIKKAVRENKLSSEFLLAYILPMIAFDFSKLKSVVLFVIYFAVLAFLCIRNSNVYTNILLEFKGYKMYLCDMETIRVGREYTYSNCLVISKNNLTVNIDNDIQCWDFENYIYIDLSQGDTYE